MNDGQLFAVIDKLPRRELFEALAEESAELTQAALKMIRACEWVENKTPVTKAEAQDNLLEEIADVELVLTCLGMGYFHKHKIEKIKAEKLNRWYKRLGLEGEEQDGRV
ncbi:hypothetical protein [Acidaminococcus fermentans]|uniref:hypothetical protein n=1 Tax=Acidaminococcus fermentans TaxID=905 RepID=UPI00265F931B|nr:hypothetical protein [Acidaminococcus fermentans]